MTAEQLPFEVFRPVPAPATTPATTAPVTTGSQPTTTTAGPSTGLTCTATNNTWDGGFVTSVTVRNGGTSAVNGWRATLTYDRSVTVSSSWGATTTASGSSVTAVPVSWSTSIPADGSASFGLQGAVSGTAPAPSCTVS